MKRKIINVLTGLLFLIGFGILVYPTVSNQWNTFRQSRLISSYEAVNEPLTPERFHSRVGRRHRFLISLYRK